MAHSALRVDDVYTINDGEGILFAKITELPSSYKVGIATRKLTRGRWTKSRIITRRRFWDMVKAAAK